MAALHGEGLGATVERLEKEVAGLRAELQTSRAEVETAREEGAQASRDLARWAAHLSIYLFFCLSIYPSTHTYIYISFICI